MDNRKNVALKSILFTIAIIACSGIFLYFIKDIISFPKGADIFGYLFRTNVLYDSICNGDFYPIYTKYWYNGTEMFQTWPPLAYYVQAFLTFFTNGDVLNSYYLFIVLCFFIQAFGWLLFGIKENKVGLSFIISLLYFIMPDNLRVMLSEGNIARLFLMAIFPYLFFFVMEFMYYKKKRALAFITFFTILITFTHLMIAAMVGLSLFIFVVCYSLKEKEFKYGIILLLNTIISYLLAGLVLIPGALGGMLGLSSSADAELGMWTEDLSISLNPILRLDNPNLFYFSSILILFLIIGLICFRKKTFPLFASAFIIFLLTSSELIPFFKLLPLSQVFWTKRLIPIAYILAFIGIIYWSKIRKSVIFVLLILLLVDIYPSLYLFDFNHNDKDGFNSSDYIQEYIDEEASEILLDKASEITSNRLMIVDESSFGPIPSYYLSTNNKDINFINGWGLQGAMIRDNIVRVNEALKTGYYYYVFDRLIELGADTAILKKDFVKPTDYQVLKDIGLELGYELIDENELSFLFKLKDVNFTYGTINNYHYLAIGKSSYYIEYLYPAFLQGESIYIDDYSFNDLVQYEKIYLSGFEYHNKEDAEILLKELANEGIEIYIDMNHIPVNKLAGKNDFLGVTAQEISFTEKFPILEVDGYQFKLDFATNMYDSWLTVYLTGLSNIKSSSFYMTHPNLAYWGTDSTDKINFIGFNLIYYCVENKTEDLLLFFNKVFNIEVNETSHKEIVPINIQYNTLEDEIIITSSKDNVSTNLSACKTFSFSRYIKEENNMVIVNNGTTVIDISYPYFQLSLLCTGIGFCAIGLFWVIAYIALRDKHKED